MLLGVLVVILVGTGLAALTESVGVMIAARVVQGALSYITRVFQPVEELAPGISRADRPRLEANGTNGT